ncbi:MAG TPA: aldehyde dehydrogenase family protein, partial [Vicinamibacterales bacterium]|nr:aldehyde dehydrogenase family protein [Vicinamibacterales bacterium]
MTTITESERALTTADPRRVQVANDVIRSLKLPQTGIPVSDPATAETIAFIPDVDVDGALESVRAANAAGAAWAKTTPRRRADVLHAWWQLLVDHTEDLAHLITREMGKPLSEARGEVKYGTDFVRWYAEEAVRPVGNFREAPDGGADIITRRAPVGLAVLITPWNFPLAMATRKIAPAIAAGCAAVVKPATLTPLTTLFAVELAYRAGVPADLVQVVTTSDSAAFSNAVLRDERVRKVSFTGSTPVGKQLMQLASENVLRSSMELGGNAPLVVFDDADLERAVAGTLAAKLRNGGQSCIAANRIYVQEGIADDFVDALTARLAGVAVGNGFGEGTVVGPLIDNHAVSQMAALTEDAIAQGATLRTGGFRYHAPGNFFAPTLLDHTPQAARVAKTEIFGPIAAIQRFRTQQEAV